MKTVARAVIAFMLTASLHANMIRLSVDQHISVSGYVPTKSYHLSRGTGGVGGQVTSYGWGGPGLPDDYRVYYTAASSAGQSAHWSGSTLEIETHLVAWADSSPGAPSVYHSWANAFYDATFLVDRPTPFSLDLTADWDYAAGLEFFFGRTDGTWGVDTGIRGCISEFGPISGVLAPGEYWLLWDANAEGLGDIRSTEDSHLRISTAWVPDGGPDLRLLALVLAAVLISASACAAGPVRRGHVRILDRGRSDY